MRKWPVFILTLALCMFCAAPASALSYDIDAPEDYLFGQPTSDDTIYEWENPNQDRSKNTAFIPPGFGTPTSYLPNSGEYLTPNLVPGALNGGLVNEVGSGGYSGGAAGSSTTGGGFLPSTSIMDPGSIPDASVSAMEVQYSSGAASMGFTEVTSGLYREDGSLGRLEIPSIGVSVKIYEGTDNAQLAKGAGHFPDTSIWDGNVCLASHNRGASDYFGKIHTLSAGDKIVLTTALGTRTYSVSSVEKISETDASLTEPTLENCISLFTCVRDERTNRWCVRGVAEA